MTINPCYEAMLEQAGLTSYEAVLDYSGQDFAAQSHTSSTVRVRIHVEGNEHVIYLKRYWYPKPKWKYVIRDSRAKIEQRNLEWMKSAGFHAPDVVAWGENRGRLHLKSCFIITLGVPESVTVLDYLEDVVQREASSKSIQEKRSAIKLLAENVAAMHRRGYVDHDLHFRNILISKDENGIVKFSHIDSPKGSLKQYSSQRGIIYDLGCLNEAALRYISRTDCLRFFHAYLGHEKIETVDIVFLQRIEVASKKLREELKTRRQKELTR